MNLIVYQKGEPIPENLIEQVKEYQSELISEYFSDPYTFSIGFIIDDEDIVLGVGIIRVVNEFKMQVNPELSNIQKVKVIKGLLDEAISRRHCGEVLVSVTQGGEHYEKILEKHFDFSKINGSTLKWEI